ncbi:MAG TPA: sigma 54-interacting transcriptional regulator [Methylomirabilota bacterium]
MRAVRYQVEQVAATDVAVLVRGEPGVGKDLVGRAVHTASARCLGPFIRVSCGAVARELIEDELFGHEVGAHRDATHRRRGKIERAHGGTLTLDEVGDLPISVQTRLLHFIETGAVTRKGGSEARKVDVRLVALTSRNLEMAARRGDFLDDLLERLGVVTIDVPPLRERRQEIAVLARMFIHRFNVEFDRSVALEVDAVRRLEAHDWPGNVRELMYLMRRLVMLNRGTVIPEDLMPGVTAPEPDPPLPAAARAAGPSARPLALKEIARRAARDAERAVINEALERSQGNRAQAARLLRVSYKALLYKMGQCGLTRRVIP